MASYIFSKLKSLGKPITPNKLIIEIDEGNDVVGTPLIVDVYDNDYDVVEEVGDDVVEDVVMILIIHNTHKSQKMIVIP